MENRINEFACPSCPCRSSCRRRRRLHYAWKVDLAGHSMTAACSATPSESLWRLLLHYSPTLYVVTPPAAATTPPVVPPPPAIVDDYN